MAQNWKDFVNSRNRDIHSRYIVNPSTNLIEGLKSSNFLTDQDYPKDTAEDAWTICAALYNAKITSKDRLNILVSIFIAAGQKPIADIVGTYKGPFLKSNLRQQDATASTRLPASQIVEATSTGQQQYGVNPNAYFHRNTDAFQSPKSIGTQNTNTGCQGNSCAGPSAIVDYGQNNVCGYKPDNVKRNTATSTATPTTFLYRNY